MTLTELPIMSAGRSHLWGLGAYRQSPDCWGQKPADLPVQQATKVELIVNPKTAKALGVTVPLPLLGRAEEVIE